MTTTNDSFSAFARLDTQSGPLGIYQLAALRLLNSNLGRLPFSIRVLLSSLPRNCDGFIVTEDGVRRLANWKPKAPAQVEQQFMPSRVILHDFTGVPVLVDIAAMRVAVARLGGGRSEADQSAAGG